MDNRYKIIVSSKNLYKEIELAPDARRLRLGTPIESDVRLMKDMFFGTVELTFYHDQEGWTVTCSDNLYLTVGDVRKMMTLNLNHGDIFEVHYQNTDNLVFDVEFLIDWDTGKRQYERKVDISGWSKLGIGVNSGNNIVLQSPYVINDNVVLTRKGQDYNLQVLQTTNGIYHNDKKIDRESLVKNGDFFSISDYSFYYKDDILYTDMRNDMIFNLVEFRDEPRKYEYPKFTRNTRVKTVIDDEKIKVLDPPAVVKKNETGIIARLIPSLIMIIIAIVLAQFGRASMLVMAGMMAIMSIATAFVSLIQDNKKFKKDTEKRKTTYTNYIEKKREEFEEARREELKQREEIYRSQEANVQNYLDFSPDLFDRVPEDEDFMVVRLGTGSVSSARQADVKERERLEYEDDFEKVPEELKDEYEFLENAPIVCDFKVNSAVGIIGPDRERDEIFKNIVLDIAARHYYTDLKMFFVVEEEHKDKLNWLRLLPHGIDSMNGQRLIVCDQESKNIIFERLYRDLTSRYSREKNTGAQRVIVFFLDDFGFKNHPISRFVDESARLNYSFVFFADHKEEITTGCSCLITVDQPGKATLIDTSGEEDPQEFVYPVLDNRTAENIVSLLAPVYTEEISLEGSLTKSISMFEMLNILAVDDIDLAKNWASSQVDKSMAAPIGVSKTDMISLDLHDSADGPHGLVAGTTGSGKSELLQTYIASVAIRFHPHEVGFMIIDFKGGGMANQFRNLPHLMGTITNIDGKEIERSLKSIKAELQKRQRYFAEVDVNHIDKYINKYKKGETNKPLPHLIIVVDEFAELKMEQPEFMKELISASRIGRSLGVHLILATQKPAGQVDDQIWSNSRFRLCLKVQTPSDSNEVIKSPLAAEIKEPGRAYLQIGNNEVFELFQSGYSGASEKADADTTKEFKIFSLEQSGKKELVFQQKRKKGESQKTQLEATIDYIANYCKETGLDKLPDICLPSLSTLINFPKEEKLAKKPNHIIADIGIFDDPNNQFQGPYSLDMSTDHVLLVGSAQTGKTNFLQNIIRSVTTKYTPEQVNIYIMDFASMVLKNFESLAHVGGVVTASEDEKMKNLMKLLTVEIEERKEKLLEQGVSSFTAYLESGKTDLPSLILLIDNFIAMKELFFKDADEDLLNLLREGISVGLSIVVSNPATTGIGYKYMSNFPSKVALYNNDSQEYSALFQTSRLFLDDIPGRGLVRVDNEVMDMQTYLAFEGEREIERIKSIRSYIKAVNEKYEGRRAKPIPVIPEALSQTYMLSSFTRELKNRFDIPIGIDYGSVAPTILNMSTIGPLGITGAEESGKHNWVRYCINALDRLYPNQTKVYVIDGLTKKLNSLKQNDNVMKYTLLANEAPELVKYICEELESRYMELSNGNDEILTNSDLIVLVLDSYDAYEAIQADKDAAKAFDRIVNRYKSMNICVILSKVENMNISFDAPEPLKALKKRRQYLFFDNLAAIKTMDVPYQDVRRFKKPIDLGDAYYINDLEVTKIKTPLVDESEGEE